MIAAVLLAAGAARRFGASKLVAPLRGEPLVRHAAQSLIDARSIDSVFVVLGNDAARVRVALRGLDVCFVEHPEYALGIGSSIAAGVAALPETCDACVIALGDQPSISTSVFDALVAEWRTSAKPVVATRYRGMPANPVLFDRRTFRELGSLDGDVGARNVVMADAARVRWLDLDEPIPIDIDIPDDLTRL